MRMDITKLKKIEGEGEKAMYKRNRNMKIGKMGENIATKFLEKNNYQILCRNFRCRNGEVDIVAKDKEKNEIVFVEVKTRTNIKYGIPAEAVNTIKQKHIVEVSNYFLYKHRLQYYKARYDIIEIYINQISKKFKIRQVKNCEFSV